MRQEQQQQRERTKVAKKKKRKKERKLLNNCSSTTNRQNKHNLHRTKNTFFKNTMRTKILRIIYLILLQKYQKKYVYESC